MDAVSNLLDKVLPAVGPYRPSRDTMDRRIVGNGYTHVENYLNGLAGDPVPGGLE